MERSKTLINGDIRFPKYSYIVFVYSSKHIEVVASSSIEYLDDEGEIRLEKRVDPSACDVDAKRMQLKIDNALINNVRWFDVRENKDSKLEIRPRKYPAKVGWRKYFASLFTLGVLGCVFLRKKNKEVIYVAENWDKSQQELCKWGFLGKEISQLVGDREWRDWKSEYDTFLSFASPTDLDVIRKQYGNLQAIRTTLESFRKQQELESSQATSMSREDMAQWEECKEQKMRLEMELNDLAKSEEDKRIIKKLQHSGGLPQLESQLEELKQHGTHDNLRRKLNLARDIARVFGENGVDYFIDLKNDYDQVRNAKHNLERQMEQLQEDLDRFGNEEDRRMILGLKSNFNNDFRQLQAMLSFAKEVSHIFGGLSLDEIRRFKYESEAREQELREMREKLEQFKEYESLRIRFNEQLERIQSLEDYREQALGWEREIKEFGTLEEREIIRKLRYYEGGLAQLDRDISDLEHYGKMYSIKQQLEFGQQVFQLFGTNDLVALRQIKQESLERVPQLQQKIQDLEDRERRWQSLTSSGQSLEYLEDIKRQGESEVKTEKGRDFEKEIESILSEMDNGGLDRNFFYKPQHGVSGSIADFLVEIKNEHHQTLKIVVECKRYGDYGEQLAYLAAGDAEDDAQSKKKLIDQGIKQICDYYIKNGAGLGLVVTDIDLTSIGQKHSISRIRELPTNYQHRGEDMRLLLVHKSCFRTLMLVLKLVMNVWNPQVELQWSTEQLEKLHNNPEVYEFVKEVMDLHDKKSQEFQKIVGDFEQIIKKATLGHKRCNKLKDKEQQLYDCVEKLKISHQTYADNPLQLDSATEVNVIDEEEQPI